MAKPLIVVKLDAKGHYLLPGLAHGDIQRVDIADVDIVLTAKNGDHYLLAGAGLAAMSDAPPDILFSNADIPADQLIGEVGAVLDVSDAVPMPSSLKLNGAQEGGEAKDNAHEQQQPQQEQQPQTESNSQAQASSLTVDTEASVEQLVQTAQQIQDDLHKSDYDYVAPHVFEPLPSALSPPPGVPPPISLTPIVTLFMGNVVGTTETVSGGTTTIYGGGGATGTDASAQIGPRDALQFSAATITGTSGNDVIYADGPLVGNTNPASESSFYAKEFILNVAGYFTSLNPVSFTGVPSNVSIVGATSNGGGSWTLPASYVLDNQAFTLLYNTTGETGTFDIEVNVSGLSTRGVTFQSQQDFRFEYLPVTNVNQVTDPTLVYDEHGISKEVYVLPTLEQPNIINSGQGNDIVYGGLNNDSITVGDGTDQVYAQNGNNTIVAGNGADVITAGSGSNTITAGNGGSSLTVGDGANVITTGTGNDTLNVGNGNNTISDGGGNNTITVGSGNNSITAGNGSNTITTGNGSNIISVGAGAASITAGSGNDSITTAGGGGTINAGGGSNTILINSTPGSTDSYVLTTTGAGTNTIVAGDDLYTVTMGTGRNAVTLGTGTSGFNTQITAGAGTNTITTGGGEHTINVGAGLATIVTGSGNDTVTTAGGGGSINLGAGNNSITINSTSGSTDNYALTTSGAGSTTVSGGDDNYVISAGTGVDMISVGNGANNITTTGSGNDTVTAGNGAMTITEGGGNNTITTGTGNVTISAGGGNNAITTAGGGGSITAGGGTNTIMVTSGNYTVTTGAGNDTISAGNGNNTINAGNGTNSVTVGSGNNLLIGGSGNDTLIAGNGTNTFRGGLGTNSFTGGSGVNTADFSDVTSTAMTIHLNTGAATGTGVSDTFSGISDVIGTNLGDTIYAGSGTEIIYGGTGNDTITAGSGTDTIYGGNGNNVYYGSTGTDSFYGGTGNNTFDNPTAGSHYDGTKGAALATITNNLAYAYTNGSVVDIYLNKQINEVNYSADNNNLTINLASGTGIGGTAQGASYASTPVSGYNSINEIAVGNGTDSLTPSYSDTVFLGGTGSDTFNDLNTLTTQHIVIVSKAGYSAYNMGPAQETIVTNNSAYDFANYQSSPTGIVLNLDDVSHSFTNNTGGTSSVAAYSGASLGDNSSYSIGDYFPAVSGTSSSLDQINGTSGGTDIIFGGSNFLVYYSLDTNTSTTDTAYAGTGGLYYSGLDGTDYFYGGSTNDIYRLSYGNDRADGAGGFNILFTVDTYGRQENVTVYLNGNLNINDQAVTSPYNLVSGGVTYSGYATGYNTYSTPTTTLFKNFENVVGWNGNDYLVGDDSANQINGEAGSNTIYGLGGNDIITAIQGTNYIDGGTGVNTINFEYNDTAINNGGASGVYSDIASFSPVPTAGDSVFLGNGTFFGANDQTSLWGAGFSGFQSLTGDGYSTIKNVQIINGSDYASGSTTAYDELLYGTSTTTAIYGNSGNNIVAGGGGADTLYGGPNNNIFYETPSQLASLVGINGTEWAGNLSSSIAISGSARDVLRVEGWGSTTTSGDAFGSSDPFSGTKYSHINVLDVRSGTDTLSGSSGNVTINEGAGSTTNTLAPTYNLSGADIQNLVGSGASSTLKLYLDNGDVFAPSAGSFTVSSATTINTVAFTQYAFYTSSAHTTLVSTVDVHFGTGTA